jgi:hypothetical protein
LADERSTGSSHIDHNLLRDFPNDLVVISNLLRNSGDALDRSIGGHNHVLNLTVPESSFSQVLNEMLVNADELTTEDTSGINVGSEGFERLVVTKNLRGRGSGHGGN